VRHTDPAYQVEILRVPIDTHHVGKQLAQQEARCTGAGVHDQRARFGNELAECADGLETTGGSVGEAVTITAITAVGLRSQAGKCSEPQQKPLLQIVAAGALLQSIEIAGVIGIGGSQNVATNQLLQQRAQRRPVRPNESRSW
jgi:hypothetical protein